MKSRMRTQKKRTREQSQETKEQAKPMFQSRPFVVQSQSAQKEQQPDLKTALQRAERYGQKVSRLQPVGVSTGDSEEGQSGSGKKGEKAGYSRQKRMKETIDVGRKAQGEEGGEAAIQRKSDEEMSEAGTSETSNEARESERLEGGSDVSMRDGGSDVSMRDVSETGEQQRANRKKQVSYFKSKDLRFARRHRVKNKKLGLVNNPRTGRNYATARISVTEANNPQNVHKVRYLTMRSGEGPKGAPYKTGHSEKNLITRVDQINDESRKQGGMARKYKIDKISSELEDCGQDNNNCNRLVANHPDRPAVRYGIGYADRRLYMGGTDGPNEERETRKEKRANAMKKLRKAGTVMKNHGADGPETKHETKIDSDYSDLEYDSASSGTDTEYETDVEDKKAEWNQTRPDIEADRKKKK